MPEGLNFQKRDFLLGFGLSIFAALEMTYEKGIPLESIFKLFSDSLNKKIFLSGLICFTLVNWSRKNIYLASV
jgi:hypothetical protein